jgi:hypothetical protein
MMLLKIIINSEKKNFSFKILFGFIKLILLINAIYSTRNVYINTDFPIIALTSFQFLFIYIGLKLCLMFRTITYLKTVSNWKIFASSILTSLLLLFTNLSICNNSLEIAQQISFIQLPLQLITLFSLKRKINISFITKLLPVSIYYFGRSHMQNVNVHFHSSQFIIIHNHSKLTCT